MNEKARCLTEQKLFVQRKEIEKERKKIYTRMQPIVSAVIIYPNLQPRPFTGETPQGRSV